MPVRALTPLTFATNAARHSPNKAPRTRANGGQSFDLISIVCACQAQAELLFKIYHFAQVTPNDTYVYSAPSTLPLEHFTLGPKTRTVAVSPTPFLSRTRTNCTNPNTSPTKTYDSYTWPDSVAPSTHVTPVPLSYHAGWLPRIKKAVPVSDRVLRSHVGNKFRGLAVTPLNGLDFD